MKDRKLVINEAEAAVVHRIFERFAKGTSVTTIGKELTAEGYRYYVSQSVIRGVAGDAALRRLPAGEVEAAVIAQVRVLVRSPEIVVATWRAARNEIDGLTEAEVREALERLDPLWDELFPAEQVRIIQLLVERVDVAADGMDIRLRVDGLARLFSDLVEPQQRAA